MFCTGDTPGELTPRSPGSPAGRHLLVEFHGCERAVLVDAALLEALLRRAATDAETRVLQACFHCFCGGGVTGVLILAESHLSIHTWPEHGYAAVDVFTCGAGRPERALEALRSGLQARQVERLLILRGGELSVERAPSSCGGLAGSNLGPAPSPLIR